jgi:hypothetical protein
MIPESISPGDGPIDGCRFADKTMREQDSKTGA